MTAQHQTDPAWLIHRAEGANQYVGEKPTIGYNLDGASDFILIPNRDHEVTTAMRNLAGDAVVGHPCELDPQAGIKVCHHPDHQRDHDALSEALQAVGLIPYRETPKPKKRPPSKRTAKVSQLKPKNPERDSTWQDDAACAGFDLVLFFGPEGERQPEREIREPKAQKVCKACPVRSACLNYAIATKAVDGVWGGLNEDERASERRRRMRRANAA